MKVLVTGCCGFIGSHLVLYLSYKGYNVYCIDNLSRATRESIEVVKRHDIVYKVVDITNSNNVVECIREFKPSV